MSSKLPINLEDLLRQRKVEGDRIEYKKGWNPDPITRTLCAFANDFENLGGGYIVIGQDCDEAGMPVFPPAGVPDNQLDSDTAGTSGMLQPDPAAIFSPAECRALCRPQPDRLVGAGRTEPALQGTQNRHG